MTKFLGFDTETVIENKVHSFLSFQVYSEDFKLPKGSSYYMSFNEQDLIKFLTKKFNKSIFVTFNLSFDSIVVSRILKGCGYEVYGNIAGSRITRLTIKKGKFKWVFVDLKNILTVRNLEKVGELLNVPKMKKPQNLGYIKREQAEKDLNFKQYAIRDAEICYKAVKMLYSEFNTFRATCAGLAVRVFKRDYCKLWKLRPKLNKTQEEYYDKVMQDLRLSYHGGRTECFIRGTNFETVYSYDVNSLYPYVMATKNYPFVLSMFQNPKEPDFKNEGIAHATVQCEHGLPVLAIKHKTYDGFEKLVFPHGKFEGWFTYPELRAFKGQVLNYHKVYEWKGNFNPFKKYILDFWKMKQKAEKESSPKREFYKVMLNSLYGKFGEHGEGRKLVFDGDQIIQDVNFPLNKRWYHSVILASYITAYARLHLWHILKDIEPSKLYYCDTDSVMTSQNLDHLLKKELGKLKLEGTAKPQRAIFIRSKFYVFNDEVVMKGYGIIDRPEMIKNAIWQNNLVSYEHLILKALEAKRIGKLPLTDVHYYKKFSCDSDGKRDYLEDLKPKELITKNTQSNPIRVEF